MMYLQITYTYYTHTTNISQEEKEAGLREEIDKLEKNTVETSQCMLGVCKFFYAALTLKQKHLFNPGAATAYLKS